VPGFAGEERMSDLFGQFLGLIHHSAEDEVKRDRHEQEDAFHEAENPLGGVPSDGGHEEVNAVKMTSTNFT